MHSLLEIMEDRVADRNGEVISRAFREASITCGSCQYPENAKDFHLWLGIHIDHKIELHRAKRSLGWHRDFAGDGCGEDWRGWRHKFCCQKLEQQVYEANIKAARSKEILRGNWPCENCIRLYNPTARINHVIRNNPELKGFLDVRFD